jgi:hypothetical protein
MKFEVNQIIEIVDNKPVIISTDIRVISPTTDLYSLARDYVEEYGDYIFVQRSQYSGYKIKDKKGYKIVLVPQQERLIICSFVQSETKSKLFPYLWETAIATVKELHEFFESWNELDTF